MTSEFKPNTFSNKYSILKWINNLVIGEATGTKLVSSRKAGKELIEKSGK